MIVRVGFSFVLAAVCFTLSACGGSDEATPPPSSTPRASSSISATAGVLDEYPGAVVGGWRTVNGQTYVTESGTGLYYWVLGVPAGTVLGQVLFVVGTVKPIPNVPVIRASFVTAVPETGSVGCEGTLTKRGGRYFVESSAEGGCGSVELIEGDPQKLDPKVGQETTLPVRYCTVTKEGRMVKTDLDPDFVCSSPYP